MAKNVSWRGRRRERRPVIRHRWQRKRPVGEGGTERSRRPRSLGVMFWLATFLFAMGLLVFYLLLTPIQTPLIAVVAGPYQWPYPPNAWALEDRDGLAPLDGQTLTVVDTSSAWQSIDRGLRALEEQCRASREQAIGSGIIVLSISMHGAVNAEGAPCLIPPGASPHNARSWLPLRRVFDLVRRSELPPEVHKLIILDAGRMRANWNIGLLDNAFVDRLDEAVEQADIPNLVVLNSAGSGQRGWSTPELQGSVFGHYLTRGLAGAADRAPGGDGDRQVSLHELHGYLRRNVDAWVRRHRGARQQPIIVPADAANCQLAWSLNDSRREGIENRLTDATPPAPAVNSGEVTELWRRRDALPAVRLRRFDPITWHRLQNDLVWLEQAATAGRGYDALAQQIHADLKSRLNRLERFDNRQQPALRTSNGTRPAEQTAFRIPTHHLPLAALFGQSEEPAVSAARAALDKFKSRPTIEDWFASLRKLADNEQQRGYDQIHFARLLARYRITRLWQQPGLASAVIATRRQSARASIHGDERVQFWNAGMRASADSARRSAEDLMFLGPGVVDSDPGQIWDSVASQYADLQNINQNVAESLRLRDRGWAMVPYLARWLTHPLHRDKAAIDLEETLLPLIQNLHRLSRTLAAGSDGADPPTVDLSRLTRTVRQQLETLEQEFQNSVRSLTNANRPSAEACREIIAVLDGPLATADQRENLSQKLIDFSGQLSTAGRRPDSQAATPGAAPVANLHTHPALAMLDRDWLTGKLPIAPPKKTGGPPNETPTAEAGERLRELLATLPAELQAWTNRLSKSDEARPRTFPFRAGWPQAELVRIAAGFSLPRLQSDPVDRLRRLDLQSLLLRQAERALEDFYGPAAPDGRPFFEIAAEDYLHAAQMITEPPPQAERSLTSLRTLLKRRSGAARTALRTSGHPILLIDQTTNVSTHSSVEATASARGLPTGRAAVFLGDKKGRIPGSTHSLPLPLVEGKPVEFDATVGGANLSGRGPRLSAVALFRGNEFRASVPVDPAGGYLVEHVPETSSSASVTLGGTARQRLSVVLVLDCSSSMSEPLRLEAPRVGDRPGQTSRMEVAKNALSAMLEGLANNGNARVGVWFYGHRLGWSMTEPNRIMRQTDYNGNIPDNLTPNRDAEAIQHLGRFDAAIAAEIENRLDSVKPWGQTPLYYAIVQSLREFSGEDPDTKKVVVVITDGLNYQYNDPDPTTQSDVLDAWSRNQAPIHIVGFGIPDDDAADAYRQFTRLAEQTGGDYRTPAASATSLINSIESLLGSSQYRMIEEDGTPVGAADLDAPISVDSLKDRPREFVIESNRARQRISLWGGEEVRLLLDENLGDIRSVRYKQGHPSFFDLVTGTPPRPTGLQLGVHRPLRLADGVRFTASIQRADNDFTPRPAESWIEITPVDSSEETASRPIPLYLQHFEPRKPVPVLSWLVQDWPDDADRATVRFWAKPDPTEPAALVGARTLLEESTQTGTPPAISALKDVTLTAHSMKEKGSDNIAVLQIVEQHSPEEAELVPLKITAMLDKRRPVRVSRRIDPKHRLFVHRFTFDGIRAERLGDVRLSITTPRELRQNAWQLPRPVDVSISDVNGLMTPTDDRAVLRQRLPVD